MKRTAPPAALLFAAGLVAVNPLAAQEPPPGDPDASSATDVPATYVPTTALVTETALVYLARGDRYPDGRYFFHFEVGGRYDYHPEAGVSVVIRTAVTVEPGEGPPTCSSPCAIEETRSPWSGEVRFQRRWNDRTVLEVGFGKTFDLGGGVNSHLGVGHGPAMFLLHADRYEEQWHWMFGAGLTGASGLYALGGALLLRVFLGFADSLDEGT